MNRIDDVANDVGAKALRLGCCEVTILKPVLVSLVVAELHVAREEMKFVLDVGGDAIPDEVPAGPVSEQVKDSIECRRKRFWVDENVLPQLMELRNTSNVLQQAHKVAAERNYVLKSLTYETDDELHFFVPQRD